MQRRKGEREKSKAIECSVCVWVGRKVIGSRSSNGKAGKRHEGEISRRCGWWVWRKQKVEQ